MFIYYFPVFPVTCVSIPDKEPYPTYLGIFTKEFSLHCLCFYVCISFSTYVVSFPCPLFMHPYQSFRSHFPPCFGFSSNWAFLISFTGFSNFKTAIIEVSLSTSGCYFNLYNPLLKRRHRFHWLDTKLQIFSYIEVSPLFNAPTFPHFGCLIKPYFLSTCSFLLFVLFWSLLPPIYSFLFCFSLLFFALPSLPIILQVGDFRELSSHHPWAAPNFPEHVSFVG